MDSQLNIGSAVAEVRRLRGMTQKSVSEVSGLTVNYISLIENGDRTPSIDVLYKLSQALDVPAGFIMFLADETVGSTTIQPLMSSTKEAIRLSISADSAT